MAVCENLVLTQKAQGAEDISSATRLRVGVRAEGSSCLLVLYGFNFSLVGFLVYWSLLSDLARTSTNLGEI